MSHFDRPYFVYGTLRPRCGNSQRWRAGGGTAFYDGEAVAHGFELIQRRIPYALQAPVSSCVTGCLILPPDDLDRQINLRWSLDELEQHPDHYERIETSIETPDGFCDAWIYTPTRYTPTGDPIPSGDFYDYLTKLEEEEDELARQRARASGSFPA